MYTVSPKGALSLVNSYDKSGILRTYSNPDHHAMISFKKKELEKYDINTDTLYMTLFATPRQNKMGDVDVLRHSQETVKKLFETIKYNVINQYSVGLNI